MFKNLPFDRELFTRGFLIAAILMATIFAVAILFFEYEMMTYDGVGIIISTPLLGYWIHLLMISHKRKNQ